MRRISKIILSIFLIHTSPASAGVGDVYYCVQKEHIKIQNFKLTKYKLGKFTFKRTAQGLIFGKGGDFNDLRLQRKILDVGTETYRWGDKAGNLIWAYNSGEFNFVGGSYGLAIAIQGTCEVFN